MNDLYPLCLFGAGAVLFLGCFLTAFDPLPVKLLGGALILGAIVFGAAAAGFARKHQR
jgi:hypothetical protein